MKDEIIEYGDFIMAFKVTLQNSEYSEVLEGIHYECSAEDAIKRTVVAAQAAGIKFTKIKTRNVN